MHIKQFSHFKNLSIHRKQFSHFSQDQNKSCILCFLCIINLHAKFKKGDLFIGQSDNKERKPAMYFILSDKETVKLETLYLRLQQQLVLITFNCVGGIK